MTATRQVLNRNSQMIRKSMATKKRSKLSPPHPKATEFMADYLAGEPRFRIYAKFGISRFELDREILRTGAPMLRVNQKRVGHNKAKPGIPVPEGLVNLIPGIRILPAIKKLEIIQLFESGADPEAMKFAFEEALKFSP